MKTAQKSVRHLLNFLDINRVHSIDGAFGASYRRHGIWHGG
jgi:hypothetical protein